MRDEHRSAIDWLNSTSAEGIDFFAVEVEALRLEVLGEGLSWQRLDNRRASRVATYHDVSSTPPLDENPKLAAWAIETMVRWNEVLRDIVTDLEPAAAQTHGTDTTM
ncbi:MAG: hypothetical protein ACC726_02375 [Chloroflexota bacterium]